uniref:Peptidase C1A papain C-terminal domain-containing protein n=1 Tax=Fibrocapsa japonica TaxID=94617 RepID=A0A7S2V2M6_9STRA|mmetsp:Transcript_21745/g.31553  ORF Transcript_21745/g.31553 Transcript_21745/m.31553 type:complete len:587 (+) Transcript_21745:38-1798(+)
MIGESEGSSATVAGFQSRFSDGDALPIDEANNAPSEVTSTSLRWVLQRSRMWPTVIAFGLTVGAIMLFTSGLFNSTGNLMKPANLQQLYADRVSMESYPDPRGKHVKTSHKLSPPSSRGLASGGEGCAAQAPLSSFRKSDAAHGGGVTFSIQSPTNAYVWVAYTPFSSPSEMSYSEPVYLQAQVPGEVHLPGMSVNEAYAYQLTYQYYADKKGASPCPDMGSTGQTHIYHTRNSVKELLSTKAEADKQELFRTFKNQHKKKYRSLDEESMRYQIFDTNLARIDDLNIRKETVTYGVTHFTDLTAQEFDSFTQLHLDSFSLSVYQGKQASGTSSEARQHRFVPPTAELRAHDFTGKRVVGSQSAEFDWREHGAVSPVKDQGLCGDCWAFAAAQDIEGTWFLKTGQLNLLSAQQIASCDIDQEVAGCQGGIMSSAYEYVLKAGGVVSEEEYPYGASSGSLPVCMDNLVTQGNFMASISGWTQISTTSDDDLKEQLTSKGPLAVAIDSSQMQFYMGGVDIPDECSPAAVDHGVLLVGYGVERGPPGREGVQYWLIKNSWGKQWGEGGYYKIAMYNGACGVHEIIQHSFV